MRHTTETPNNWEQLEKESKKLDRQMLILFGTLTAICCGITFAMILDGIFHIF